MAKFYWRPTYTGYLLLQLLLITDLTPVGLAKRGGGGGIGRGGSKGGSVGRGTSHTGSRGSAPAATYNKPPSSGGTYAAGGYAGKKQPSGSSLGGGGSWKSHAAAGVAGAVLGAAVSHQLTKSHYKYGYGGRDYYYGDRYYRPSYTYSRKCVYTLDPTDYKNYDDGYQVKEIVFECNSRSEHCCGMECCSNASSGLPWWGILLSILAVVCLVAACVVVVMKSRRRPATQYSSAAAGDASVPLQGTTEDITGAKAYTAHYPAGQTYPQYPQQPGNQWQQPAAYPPYGGYPAAAPAPAPAYGFNVQPSGPYPRQY